jgi:hypothetical protein
MPLPNFLIVGAAKSGTTSLYRYLQDHPQVFMPAIKEPNFFATERHRTIRGLDEYSALFTEATEPAIGEASVRYLSDRGAAARIRETLGPDTRILVLLRNPVDQAHSQWGHEVRSGGETRPFAAAVLGETAGASAQETAIDYVSRARYAAQVRRYLDAFGRTNLHVDIFEEFFADPGPAYSRVCEFLGVSADHRPEFAVHNPSGSPRSRLLSRVLGEPARWKRVWQKLVPLEIRDRARSVATAWNTSERPLPAATEQDRERLRALFDDDVRELESLLLRSLSEPWW